MRLLLTHSVPNFFQGDANCKQSKTALLYEQLPELELDEGDFLGPHPVPQTQQNLDVLYVQEVLSITIQVELLHKSRRDYLDTWTLFAY